MAFSAIIAGTGWSYPVIQNGIALSAFSNTGMGVDDLLTGETILTLLGDSAASIIRNTANVIPSLNIPSGSTSSYVFNKFINKNATSAWGFGISAKWNNETYNMGLWDVAITTDGWNTSTLYGASFNFQAKPYEQAGLRSYAFAIAVKDSQNQNGYLLCIATVADGATGQQVQDLHYVSICPDILKELHNFDISEEEIDPDYGPGSEPAGYNNPAFDHTSDTIGIPDAPSVSTSSVGFMHVYKVASGALATLGQYLFPSAQNITDVESALRAIAGIFAYRDSVQYIVDLHAIPVSPSVGNSDYIKIGSLTTDISQPIVPSDYVDFDCGSISIPEQYSNFVDYIGTRCKLFLPFVGFVEIAPEYWNGGILSVKYRFNVIDGSFMAYVRATSSKSQLSSSLIGQYGGSACLHLPVIANSYGALASGLVGGSMQIAAGAATGNIGAVATGALTASNFQGNMSQSNNYNASTSFLGGRRPYLLIEREVPCFSTQYTHDKGLPLNVSVSLSSVHGFTVIEDIDLSGITGATENELAELRQLLKEGVYF